MIYEFLKNQKEIEDLGYFIYHDPESDTVDVSLYIYDKRPFKFTNKKINQDLIDKLQKVLKDNKGYKKRLIARLRRNGEL